MMEPTIKTNAAEVREDLEDSFRRIMRAAENATSAENRIIFHGSQKAVPVKTGKLKASGGTGNFRRLDSFYAYTRYTKPYAGFVRHGEYLTDELDQDRFDERVEKAVQEQVARENA